jgi:hypothetical protein
MKYLIAVCVVLLSITTFHAQELTNDVLKKRIALARAEDNIALWVDAGTTKLMAVSENFAKDDSARAGILAMSVAVGCIYPGDTLAKSPDTFLLTFWVLSKKPRFGVDHSMAVWLKDEILVIGSARYSAKAREQMEYLNFEISRANLTKIAAESDVRFRLGEREFTFTRSQMKLFADLLVVTDVEEVKQVARGQR